MQVKVLFFGMLKDIVGRAEEQLDLPGNAELGGVFTDYADRFRRLREMAGSIVPAGNHEFADASAAVPEGFALTRHAIDNRQIIDHMLRGEAGAVITFEGVVRNNTKGRRTRYLDYECYEPMAIRMIAGTGREIAADRIAMVHRLGCMLISETGVSIIVTAPHRKAAFEAALEGINRLKRLVPIWKKEYFEDGEGPGGRRMG